MCIINYHFHLEETTHIEWFFLYQYFFISIFFYIFVSMCIQDKIKQIKYNRLSEQEKIFLETTEGMVQFKHIDFPYSTFYIKNGVILFEEYINIIEGLSYNVCLFVNDLTWDRIEHGFLLGIKYNSTKLFIREMIWKYNLFYPDMNPIYFNFNISIEHKKINQLI